MEGENTNTINATSVRLPTFSPNQPLTWFRRAERHFSLKKITSSATQADYTLEVLPEAVFQQISPWLDTQPAEIQYPDLKAKLLKEFCPTSSVRTRRILVLPQNPPADLTPTQLWHEINTLRQLPGLDENSKPKLLDLAKEIWLLCLAPQVRCALSNTDNADIQMLMEEAQQRHEAHTAARRPPSNRFGSSDVSAVHRPRQSSENTPFVKNGFSPENFVCWYHRRFGDNARKCLKDCNYKPKNSSAGCA